MVLLGGVGATIVGALVSLAAARTHVEAVQRDVTEGRQEAVAALAELDAALADDPFSPAFRVMPSERNRLCVADAERGDPVRTFGRYGAAASAEWPLDECGLVWAYDESRGAPDPGRYELAYDPDAARWRVTALGVSRDNGTDAGFVREMVRDTAAGTTAYSSGALDMSHLYKRADDARIVDFVAYARGTVTLPSAPGGAPDGVPDGCDPSGHCAWPRAAFASDPRVGVPDFSGALPSGASAYAPDPSASALAPQPRNVRSLAKQPWTSASAQAATLSAVRVACPEQLSVDPNPPANFGVALATDHPDLVGAWADTTVHACLRRGRALVDSSGAAFAIPSDAVAVQVTPRAAVPTASGGTAPGLTVAWRVDPNVDGDGDPRTGPRWDGVECATMCDVRNVASETTADRLHPGDPSYWDAERHVLWPSTGVVATDLPTFLGHCPTADAVDAGSACPPISDQAAGAPGQALWPRSVTVIAGSAGSPRPMYVSTSQHAADGARVGLVATGDLALGYWAAPPGGKVTVEAAAVALGLGDQSQRRPWRAGDRHWPSAIRSAPTHACTNADDTAVCGRNAISELRWRGSVAAPDLRVATDLFDRVVVEPDPSLADTPPPWFPSFDERWRVVAEEYESGHDVCGAARCRGF